MTGFSPAAAVKEVVLRDNHQAGRTEWQPLAAVAHRRTLIGIVIGPPERTANALMIPIFIHHPGPAFMDPERWQIRIIQKHSAAGMRIEVSSLSSGFFRFSAKHGATLKSFSDHSQIPVDKKASRAPSRMIPPF